ncbi:lysozyme [Hymenobacter norwichensis]|uniref:lysozyme n=1 Tax=Hymenobacter norwichensis TaxID=223903 RepID=UPI0003B3C981|nr:lysozyme [Hymenobacter norwichensis]
MVNNLTVDAAGRAFISHEEDEKLAEYADVGGVKTIGVGHTGRDVFNGEQITESQSQALLSKDLTGCEAAVNRLVTVPLNQHQFNALVSFAFNLGPGALEKSSLLRFINDKQTDPIVLKDHFKMWCNVNNKPNDSIRARRGREADLFLGH